MPISGHPIAAAPIAAAAEAGAIEMVLADAMAANDAGLPDVTTPLVEALQFGAEITPETLANLVASLAATTAAHGQFSLVGDADDAIGTVDAAVAAWQLLIEEEVSTVGAALGTVTKLAALADALAATGQVVGNLTAFATLVQAITLEGLLVTGFSPDAVDGLTLEAATSANARLLSEAADALLASETGEPVLRVSAIAAESLSFESAADAILRANGDLADGLLLYVTLRLGDTDYVGWMLNTDALAASQYRTAPFDSYASFKGKDYAGGPSGLVAFGGTDDDGAPIEWSLRTFLMDFGTSKFKRVPDCFIGARTDGQLVLKVITRDPGTGAQSTDWYVVKSTPAAGPGTGKVKVGRGLKSTWWAVELVNVAGASLELDSISLRPLILDRRV